MEQTITAATLDIITPDTLAARYASLHRAIESQRIDEKGWAEMVCVCARLGKRSEALSAYRNLTMYGVRARAHALLVDAGVLGPDDEKPEREESCVTEAELRPTILEAIGESFEYLLELRMIVVATGGTAAFGLLVVLGGALSRSFGDLGAAACILPIAALLTAWVWMTAARITRATIRGFDDAPEGPNLPEMFAGAYPTLLDFAMSVGVCSLPAILAGALGGPASVTIPLFLSGMATGLTAFILRQTHPRFDPRRIWGTIASPTTRILPPMCAVAVWFVPASVAFHQSLGQSVHLLAAYVGLFAVVPVLLSSRLMAQTLRFYDPPSEAAAVEPD